MPDNVIDAVKKYRKELERQDKEALNRLIDSYRSLFGRLSDKIDLLAMEIENAGEDVTLGQITRMGRYKSLLAQSAEELNKYQVLLENEVEQAARFGINLGARHSRELMSLGITGNTRLAGTFNRLQPETIQTLLGFLAPDSRLYERIKELSPNTIDTVIETLKQGVGLGYNPKKIAREIGNAYGQGLTDAMRMTRTVQLYSYREASRAIYAANDDILDGWIWHAELDADTCMSCVAMHGTIHPIDEVLDDHHNGRCAMVPIVKGFDIEVQSGESWFNNLSDGEQSKMMGKKYYAAYKDGKFGLSDLSKENENDVFGLMRTVTPLKDLL